MKSRIYCMGDLLLVCFLAGGIGGTDAVAAATESSPVVDEPTLATIDRYLPIVNRQPFGIPSLPQPTVAVAAASVPGLLANELARNYMMSVLMRTAGDETLVGFTDNSAKPPRNLLLAVGEELDGYKVLAADVDHETALLSKDGARFELRMNSGPRTVTVGKSGRGGVSADACLARIGTIRLSDASWSQPNKVEKAHALPVATLPEELEPSNDNSVREDYAARVRARRERLVKLNAETQVQRDQIDAARQQAAAASQEAKAQREARINLLRKGLNPLEPIVLTPEEDAKLVAEGVLSPH